MYVRKYLRRIFKDIRNDDEMRTLGPLILEMCEETDDLDGLAQTCKG